jgi:hypothetical protein
VWSKYLSPEAARRELPTLLPKQQDGSLLKGAVRCCCCRRRWLAGWLPAA